MTPRDSPNSLIVLQHSGHSIKHICQFGDDFAHVQLPAPFPIRNLRIAISCREPDWQLSSIEQVCNSYLDPLSVVEDFYIKRRYWGTVWKNDAIENTLCFQLLLSFTAVKNLYLFKEFAPRIVAALQELVGGRIIEVLPSLQNISVEGLEPSGPFQEDIGRFVAARRLSGHPIASSDWDKDSNTSRSTSLLHYCTSTVTADLRHLNEHLSHKRKRPLIPRSSHCTFEHLTTPR